MRSINSKGLKNLLNIQKAIFETVPGMLVLKDNDGVYEAVNPAFCEFMGKPEVKLIGKTDFDLFPETEAKKIHQNDTLVLRTGKPQIQDEEVVGEEGAKWLQVTKTPVLDEVNKPVGLLCLVRDITESKEAEEANVRLSRAIEQANETIIITDTEGTIQYVNPAFEKATGYTATEAVGQNLRVLKSGKHDDAFYKSLWKTLSSGNEWHGEIISKKKDGSLFTENATFSPVFDTNGKIVNYIVAKNDITEQKKAQQNMRDLARIVENALNEIYIFDAETFKFIQVNYGARENTGYTAQELADLTPLDIKPEFTKELFIQLVEPLRNGTKEIITFETVHKRKDGSLYNVEVHLQLSEYLNKPAFVAIILDITETKRLRELESRAARLETAGIIAGQVAHDFNNLLSPLIAYPALIRKYLPHDHKSHRYLDAIEKASRQIAEINQDLLTMGRRGRYDQEVLDLNRIVIEAAREMKTRTDKVTVEMDLCEDIMKIKGGETQIYRVLTNLLVNAQDAIGKTGQVNIKTENYYADDTSVTFGRVPKGQYVKLTIADDGCGISDEIIQKILDPFFSTKKADKKCGSGLGLSIVDAVMKDHHGYLDLSSKVGQGTSFYLYFPVSREGIADNNSLHLNGGTEMILVVDDNEIQREVSLQILTNLGYTVESVESGEKAIEFLREKPHDLVILDMVMPDGIDGAETYRRIIESYPNQKAIVLSGFSESGRVLEAQKLGAGAFIRKPVTMNAMAAAVRAELDRSVEVSSI